MKPIVKNEPQNYRDFIRQNAPSEWEEVSQKIGYDLRLYMLMEEQNYQCAYTETHVEPEDTHIDHFKKQSLFQDMTFDWNNLLASCNHEEYGAKYKDKKVRRREDYRFLIHPVIDNPHEYFTYSLTGETLVDEENQKAVTTRDCFNLNHPALLEQRKQIVHQMYAMHDQFSVDEFVGYIGKFESFIRAVYSELTAIGESF